MKNNFKLMQEVSNHTRVAPSGRIQKLLAFNKRLSQKEEIFEDFKKWHFEIDKNLIELKGRQLYPETISYGNMSKQTNESADFTRELQTAEAVLSAQLRHWFVVCPGFMMREAKVLK